jgi:hypothetical protein
LGYVYYKLDIYRDEKYLDHVTLPQLLKRFDLVDSIESAEVLAVIAFSESLPYVAHIAIVDEGKTTITHRDGPGGEVKSNVSLNKGLAPFLVSNIDRREIVYLVPKPKRKSFFFGF